MNAHLSFRPDVAEAVQYTAPVVALESTVITHGMPYPDNVEIAYAMEAAIRAQGVIPATIGVLGGRIIVGMTQDEIERLAAAPTVRKCSRRDLALAVALKEDASTTVAGTMIVAHLANIRVFATGGIGGVHRGQPMDVSADLPELGRIPVAVVCAGAKSILDLPLTREVLETYGVPVIGYGTDVMPAFYARSSGLPVDARVDTPEQAAEIIAAAGRLGFTHGFLFTVPIPEQYALADDQAEQAIAQATREADAAGIHGKAITPFVLARVAELTDGHSRQANKALLVNNVRVGAQIARALVPAPLPTSPEA